MRIIKRDEMLGMPEGTIYSESDEYANFDGLYRKGLTMVASDGTPLDWVVVDLIDFHPSKVENRCEVAAEAILTGGALDYSPMDDSCTNGDYDEESMYLVFEDIDLRRLASIILESLKPVSQARQRALVSKPEVSRGAVTLTVSAPVSIPPCTITLPSQMIFINEGPIA